MESKYRENNPYSIFMIWELAFRRSYRSILADESLWESRFGVFVKYWNK